jgi:hypothetical protein
VSVLAFVVCGAAAAGVLAAIIPARYAPINVRWRPDVTADRRALLEQRFHLANGHQTEGTTWAYDLGDSSFTNVHAIVREPAVDDTAHINRRLFRPEFQFDREARIVIGAWAAGTFASVLLLVRSNAPAALAPVRLREDTLIRVLGPAPASLLALAALILLAAVVGYRPLWAIRNTTLAEAARAGDTATVFRMLTAGSDPNLSEPVALEGRSEPAVLTPLEAAVESRQVEVVQLLMKMGALASESDRQRLACLAIAVDAPEVGAYMRSTMPPAATPDCAVVPVPVH